MHDEITEAESLCLQKQAKGRNYGWMSVFGLFLAPIALTISWHYTKDVTLINKINYSIFLINFSAFTFFLVFSKKYQQKISHLAQRYSVSVNGVMGPVNEVYETRYEFTRFNKQNFFDHKKAYYFGLGGATSIFSLLGHAFFVFVFSRII